LSGNEDLKIGLAGVEFALHRYVGKEHDDINKMKVGKKETFETNDKGKIQLKGLRPGKYRLDEVEGHPAYTTLEEPIFFKLKVAESTVLEVLEDLENKIYVEKDEATLEVVNERIVTELTAQKKWLINDDQPILSEGFSDIYLQLVKEVGDKTEYVEGSRQKIESGKQYDINVVWKNLPQYDLAGKEIEYVIQEVDQDGKIISNKAFDHVIKENIIENKINDEKFKLEIVKDWADGKVAQVNENVRPDAIKFKVTAQGESRSEEIGTYTLTAKDNWKLEIDNLYKYDHFGNPIKYIIEEVAEDDLSKNYILAKAQELLPDEKDEFILTFTNELINKINVGVKKQWNFEGAPETTADFPVVYFELYRQIPDGKLEKVGVDPIEVTQDSEIQYWNDLEQYDLKSGYEYEYLVKETDKDGNELSGFNTEQVLEENTITVTNTWNDETVNLSFNKTWNDLDNKYHTRPKEITFEIINKATEELIKEVTVLKADYEGKIVVTDLPKYDKYGQEIEYIVKEQAVLGYETVQDEKTLDFENKLILEGDQITERTVKKTWDDQNDNDGIRPEKLRVYLTMKNEEGKFVRVDNGVVLEGPEWQHTFKNLPKYAQGQEIEYGIEEEIVEGYELVSESNNFELVNKHEIETVSLKIQKEWIDGENKFNTRPEAIVVQVLANGTVLDDYSEIILDEANDWSFSIDNLPKYYEQGKEIDYEVVELDSGYYDLETEKTSSNNEIEFILRNTELISITVEKEWDDHNNQDGKRPNEIIVHLYNDEALIETVSLSEETHWQHTFTDLPRFNGSNLVQYKVIEEHVDDYIASTVWSNEGQNVKITNKYNTEKVSVSFTKVWEDANNQDGMRPETITVELLANGKVIAEKTISEKDQWQGSFDNLDKYEAGKVGFEIVYEINEKEVENYATEITALSKYDFVITNQHETETRDLLVEKVWEDQNDLYQLRPGKIVVTVYADGEQIVVEKLSEDNDWHHTFTNLPVYKDGKLIEYTVEEAEVAHYEPNIEGNMDDGFTIINSLDAAVLGTSKEPKPNTKPGSKLPSTGVGNTSLYVAAGAIVLGMVLRRKRQK
ncbi:MAG TPA: Cna B-type domain-containing protein, partial [Erysipelothrix sp.]